jgi:hypothetical protein
MNIQEIQDSIGKREISGRVWTGEDMIYLHSLELEYQNMGMIMAGGVDRCETFMQYTGLKDKNGKKIFEGDIIRHINEEADMNPYVVPEMTPDNWEILLGIMDAEWEEDDMQYSNIEIIGNVFENPSLLES